MENNNWTEMVFKKVGPHVNKNVINLVDGQRYFVTPHPDKTVSEKYYLVRGYEYAKNGRWAGYNKIHFAPINPYSNSVSKELANEAIKERVEVDCPVKK